MALIPTSNSIPSPPPAANARRPLSRLLWLITGWGGISLSLTLAAGYWLVFVAAPDHSANMPYLRQQNLLLGLVVFGLVYSAFFGRRRLPQAISSYRGHNLYYLGSGLIGAGVSLAWINHNAGFFDAMMVNLAREGHLILTCLSTLFAILVGAFAFRWLARRACESWTAKILRVQDRTQRGRRRAAATWLVQKARPDDELPTMDTKIPTGMTSERYLRWRMLMTLAGTAADLLDGARATGLQAKHAEWLELALMYCSAGLGEFIYLRPAHTGEVEHNRMVLDTLQTEQLQLLKKFLAANSKIIDDRADARPVSDEVLDLDTLECR